MLFVSRFRDYSLFNRPFLPIDPTFA